MRVSCLMIAVPLLFACGGGGGDGGPTGPTGPTGPSNPGGPTGSTSANIQIQSQADPLYGGVSFSFAPTSVNIVRTGTVTWVNNTGTEHNITFTGTAGAPANVTGFTSGTVARTFGTAGTFPYSCTLHPEMTGQVSVQ